MGHTGVVGPRMLLWKHTPHGDPNPLPSLPPSLLTSPLLQSAPVSVRKGPTSDLTLDTRTTGNCKISVPTEPTPIYVQHNYTYVPYNMHTHPYIPRWGWCLEGLGSLNCVWVYK